MSFGETLRRTRQERGLTQADLAAKIGVSHVYISALERGAKPAPRLEVVISLAHCLGVNQDDLWASAQAEREQRLRERIQGQPTSLRVKKIEGTQAGTGFFDVSAEIARLAAAIERSKISGEELRLLQAELRLLQKRLVDKEATK